MSLSEIAFSDLVKRKRAGTECSREEIEALVSGYCSGLIDDERFTLWLRAVVASGLSLDETVWLTNAMAVSGATLDWKNVAGVVVDKHSTGGVGDAVSLIAVPLAASRGVKVAKLSGRALGHTGGTLDKLECVPGLRTDLSVAAFKRTVADVGCAIAQASDELAPADKKIYALRHRTQTVESVGLITASVLSKKIAGGAPHLVIDVKCGRSAFMKTQPQAHELARMILDVGRRLGRYLTVLITDMESPLSASVGDALELDEALRVLQGANDSRLREVALAVAEAMLAVHQVDDRTLASTHMASLEKALRDGSAYERFVAMVSAQGGDLPAFERPVAPSLTIAAGDSGFVTSVDGRAIGEAVAEEKAAAGYPAGIRTGIRLRKREGDAVARGEALLDAFGPGADKLAQHLRNAVRIAAEPPASRPAIIERMHARPVSLSTMERSSSLD